MNDGGECDDSMPACFRDVMVTDAPGNRQTDIDESIIVLLAPRRRAVIITFLWLEKGKANFDNQKIAVTSVLFLQIHRLRTVGA